MKIMKTISIKHIIAAFSVGCVFVASIALTSCTDLDSDKYFGDRKTLESVFTDEIQANQWLTMAETGIRSTLPTTCTMATATTLSVTRRMLTMPHTTHSMKATTPRL